MHSQPSMGKAVYDPWERVRDRANAGADDDLRALLRDADAMRRFIEQVKRASTMGGEWQLHGGAIEVLEGLGRPMATDRVAADRREPMRLEEDRMN